jgi:ribosomal protein S18 acetylase RimI-like enzyme
LVPARFRQQGIGALLVSRLLAMADGANKDTFLTVRPIGQSSEEAISRLIRFYERFGFALVDREAGLAHMRRNAKLVDDKAESSQ